MTTERIISEFINIACLPYTIPVNGVKNEIVILGIKNCLCNIKDTEQKIIMTEYKSLHKVFNKNDITKSDELKIAQYLKNLLEYCQQLCSMQNSINSPTDFINKCSDVARDEIYNQTQMYKKAFEYYQIYINHIY